MPRQAQDAIGNERPLVITFDLQLADVERGLASLPRARFARSAAWFSMLVVAALVAWRWHEGRNPSIMVVVGAFLIVALFAGRDPAKRIAKKVYQALPTDARHVELTIDDQKLRLVSGAAATELDWNAVARALDSRHSILLFESRSSAQIIPKRALSREQYAALSAIVKRKVVPRREPWLTPAIARRMVTYLLLLIGIGLLYHFQP
jgi:YcxB-like protein